VFERRNIQIDCGGLSVGLEGLFDEIEAVETVMLYLSNVKRMEIRHHAETEVCVEVNATDLDKLAKAWLKRRQEAEKKDKE
jgi:hypothetical protein